MRSPIAQDMDTELSNLTERLAAKIKDQDKKKVAVLDFTDLQGGSSELGKYIAEQMTVNFVMTNRFFGFGSREPEKHPSRTQTDPDGLVDPDNAKKLGMFAGVDAIILGTIIPKGEKISLTAKIITTETAEIVGAERLDSRRTTPSNNLCPSKPQEAVPEANRGLASGQGDEKVWRFNRRIAVVQNRGRRQSISFDDDASQTQLPRKASGLLCEAVCYGNVRQPSQVQAEFNSLVHDVTGIPATLYQNNGFAQATEIPPGDSIPETMKFSSPRGAASTAGNGIIQCADRISFGIRFRQ